MMDHTPHLPAHRPEFVGKTYAIGYMRALIQMVYDDRPQTEDDQVCRWPVASLPMTNDYLRRIDASSLH
jgi:hypothetical protein